MEVLGLSSPTGVQAVEHGACALGLLGVLGCALSTPLLHGMHGMLIIANLSGGGKEVAAGT